MRSGRRLFGYLRSQDVDDLATSELIGCVGVFVRSFARFGAMTLRQTFTTTPHPWLATLEQEGWAHGRVAIPEAEAVVANLSDVASLLGTRVASRAGAVEELIKPQSFTEPHPRFMSARCPLRALTLHAATSQRHNPCRDLSLG